MNDDDVRSCNIPFCDSKEFLWRGTRCSCIKQSWNEPCVTTEPEKIRHALRSSTPSLGSTRAWIMRLRLRSIETPIPMAQVHEKGRTNMMSRLPSSVPRSFCMSFLSIEGGTSSCANRPSMKGWNDGRRTWDRFMAQTQKGNSSVSDVFHGHESPSLCHRFRLFDLAQS